MKKSPSAARFTEIARAADSAQSAGRMNLDIYDIGVSLAQDNGIRAGVEQPLGGFTSLYGMIDKINDRLEFGPKAGADTAGMSTSWELATDAAAQIATALTRIHTPKQSRTANSVDGAAADMGERVPPSLALPVLPGNGAAGGRAMAGTGVDEAEQAGSWDRVLFGGLSGDGSQSLTAPWAQDSSVSRMSDPGSPEKTLSPAEMLQAISVSQPPAKNLPISLADALALAGDSFFRVDGDATANIAVPFPQAGYERQLENDPGGALNSPLFLQGSPKGDLPASALQAPLGPLPGSSFTSGFLPELQLLGWDERLGQAQTLAFGESDPQELVAPSQPFKSFLRQFDPDNESVIENPLLEPGKHSDTPPKQPATPAPNSTAALEAGNREIFSQLSGTGIDMPGTASDVAETSGGKEVLAAASPPAWLVALTGAVVLELLNTGLGQNALHPAAGASTAANRASGGFSPSGTQRDPLHVRLVGQRASPNFHMPAGPAMPMPSQSRPIPGQVQLPP